MPVRLLVHGPGELPPQSGREDLLDRRLRPLAPRDRDAWVHVVYLARSERDICAVFLALQLQLQFLNLVLLLGLGPHESFDLLCLAAGSPSRHCRRFGVRALLGGPRLLELRIQLHELLLLLLDLSLEAAQLLGKVLGLGLLVVAQDGDLAIALVVKGLLLVGRQFVRKTLILFLVEELL